MPAPANLPSGSKKSIPTLILGAIVVLIAGYFGLDLGGGSDTGNGSAGGGAESADSSTLRTPTPLPPTPRPSASAVQFSQCAMNSLPPEADETRDVILAGGPYEYPEDDNRRFGNYEGELPRQSRNYYREYTVDTPGLGHRGERRIITGGGTETDPQVWYYTDDHYETFCIIPDAE